MVDQRATTIGYADQPVVGNVVVRRDGPQLTIRVLRSYVRIIQAALLAGVGLAVGLLIVVTSGQKNLWSLAWYLTPLAVGFLVSAAGLALTGLFPVVILLDPDQLSVRWRGLLEIKNLQFRRHWILDIRTHRMPFAETVIRPHALWLISSDGNEANIFVGSKAEVRYAADVLREALELPPERWPEHGYPPTPWLSRTRRTINPLEIQLSLRPSIVPMWFWILAPILACGALWASAYVQNKPTAAFHPALWTRWTLLWAACYFTMATTVVLAVLFKVRRWYFVEIDAENLTAWETGLFPAQAQWPVELIDRFEVDPRRRALVAHFRDGTEAILLKRTHRRELEWAVESLRRARVGWEGADSQNEPIVDE